ncbi:MAG TPA: biotin/lipoyl-binding protein [Solirubrobacteraceae bacterium]|nr:biotin/lipoyl-binding protein [Solirubrobacteraceae bacterium]
MTKLRSRAWYLYVLGVVGLTLVALAVAEIGPPTSSARTSTQIVTAATGVVQSTVSGSGNVEPGTDMDVNFQTSGTLSNVYVKVGQHVNKGQLLATLNSSSAQLAVDQAEQNLTAAEDQLSSAESSSSTTTTSSGSGSGSGGSGSGSSTSSAGSVPSAQAAVDSAEESVQSATTALSATKLYAPTSGTIASMAGLSVGDAVSAGSTSSASSSSTGGSSTSSTSSTGSSSTGGGAGATSAGSLGGSSSTTGSSSSSGTSSTPFAEIVNSKTMTMTVAFSESDISKVKVRQTGTITLDALTGVELGAHVTSISPVATTSSGVVSYNATLTLDQTDSQVKPGMSASASVITGQAQGVTVPNSAVIGTSSLATVTVLTNGKQTKKQVVVGLRGDTRTQIVSGLSAGDQLVVTTTLPPLTSSTSGTSTGGAPGAGGAGFGGAGGAGGRPGGFGGGGFGGGGGFPGGAGGAAGAAGGVAK